MRARMVRLRTPKTEYHILSYDDIPPGGIAQLGERLNGIQEVSGSIPLISTKLHQGRCDGNPFSSENGLLLLCSPCRFPMKIKAIFELFKINVEINMDSISSIYIDPLDKTIYNHLF